MVVLSNTEQWNKLCNLGDKLPSDLHFFSYDKVDDAQVDHWASWCGERSSSGELVAGAGASDIATILYTSGTTGEPKGVMLTQQNLSSNAQAMAENYGEAEQEVKLNMLPLSHIFARTCDLYAWLVRGSTLALAQSRESVMEDLQLVRPTTINAVPYFYDKLRKALCERKLDRTAGALRHLLGGRIRSCCSGGAPLSRATIEFFEQQEVPLYEGYGLTESSPVITMSNASAHRSGSCGRAIPVVDVRVASDGELLTRGPHVMVGYYKNPAATAAAIDEGWLHTGDLATIDDDGFVRIVGRKKEMIVLSTGKKVSPTAIEGALSQDPLVAQVMVVGEGRSHLAALVVPHMEALGKEAAQRGIPLEASDAALRQPSLQAICLERFQELLRPFSPQEQVHHVALLARGFSLEAGEMTPKLSLRREVICQHFSDQIEAMYAVGACEGDRQF